MDDLISINSLDTCDGESVVHTLASAVSLRREHLNAILDTFTKAGVIPNLSVANNAGQRPVQLALQINNLPFLQYYAIPVEYILGMDSEGHADGDSSHSTTKLKQTLMELLRSMECKLDKAIEKCS
jgi:hypothetical protein